MMDKMRKGPVRPVAPRRRPAGREELGIRIGRRNVTLFLAGLASVVLGYILLSLKAESLATILLVGGYLGLIPWAILADRRATPSSGSTAGE